MEIFSSTLNQIAFLFGFIIIGYILAKIKVIPENSAAVLSKLENTLFIPALVLGTFMKNFTVAKMSVAWQYLLCGLVVVSVSIPIAILFAKVSSKDSYIRKIYTYGLSFSNFGFMGNAVVAALFPDIFMEYLIFVLPFWVYIYVWGVPSLLMSDDSNKGGIKEGLKKLVIKDKYIQRIYTYSLSFANFGFMGNAVVSKMFPDIFFEYLIFTLPLWVFIYLWGVPRLLMAEAEKKQTFKESLKAFVNPMFIAMIIGMVIGFAEIPVPQWISSLVSVSGDCMSPIAMILTGIVVSTISLKQTFTNVRTYIISIIRLIIIPLVFIGIASFFEMSEATYICALCSLAMPLGLNTVVIPSGLGKDTTVAAGMAVISHLMSVVTIPLIFMFIK